MSKISEWIFAHRWAIIPSALEAIMEIVDRNLDISASDLAKSLHGEMWERYIDEQGNPIPVTFNALEAYNYPILENTRRVSMADNVAILPIIGPLTPRSNFSSSFSGSVSVQSLAYDFNVALASKEVSSIILDVDSPGGEITFISEFAEQIYKARSRKPVLTYVGGIGGSASYWLGSATKEIVLADTAEVGSIGVVAAYTDSSEKEAKAGIKRYEIISNQSPNKRPDLSTESGRGQIQIIVDNLADVFISAVAKYRGIESKDVLDNYGQGKMFVGLDAVHRGLADRIGSLELLISEQKVNHTTIFYGGIMNIKELEANHPEIYKEAIALGKSEALAENQEALNSANEKGAKVERDRIASIEAIDAPGYEDLIANAKLDPTANAESVSLKILEAQKKARKAMSDKLGDDGKELADSLSGVGSKESGSDGGEKDLIISSAVKAMNENR